MTTDNLFTFTGGTRANPSQVQTNDFAIAVDFVPRNAAGEPTSSGGDLGTSSYKWKTLNVAGTCNINTHSAKDIDVYNFFVKDPYTQDDIQEQLIYKAGTIVQMSAKLTGTQASPGPMLLNIENNGAIVAGTGAVSFDNVTSTVQTYTPATADVVSANDILGLSISQVGTTNAGSLLNIQLHVNRS